MAEKVFCPDIGHLKGKSTRHKPIPIVDNKIEIPDELLEVQKDVTLAMDGLTINGLKFLSTISLNIYFRTMHYMPDTTAANYQKMVDEIYRVYQRGGFIIKSIRCDNGFHTAMDNIAHQAQPPITMNYTNPQ